MKAKGIHAHPEFKLGGILGVRDAKTLKLSDLVARTVDVGAPQVFNYDDGKPAFPVHTWGNTQYGDCELAGRANYLVRLQYGQTSSFADISDDDVVNLYKQMTGCASPGDNNDTGLATLDNLNQWRHGWTINKNWDNSPSPSDRDFSISAFGQVDFKDNQLLRNCIFLFSGVLFGFNMPANAQAQTGSGVWDVDPSGGEDAQPGSWGGHCVYSCRFDTDNIYVLTWGQVVRVTNAWLNEYCMEAYSVVDSLDNWMAAGSDKLDVTALIKEMQAQGISVQQ